MPERAELSVIRLKLAKLQTRKATGCRCHHLLREIGIGLPLDPDLRGWAVSGQHRDIIAQWQKFGVNPVEQQIAIASGEIPAAHAPGEKNVPTKKQAGLLG